MAKSKTKTKSKSSKKSKTSRKKASLKTARAKKPKKSSKTAKKAAAKKKKKRTTKKVSKKSPKKASSAKSRKKAPQKLATEIEKPLIPLNKPFQLFMEVWNPKNESFFMGIRKLLSQYSVPGKTDKQKEASSAQIIEKIESAMQKESLSPELVEQLSERFSPDRIRKMSSIMAMGPRATIRLNILKADIQGFAQSKVAKDLKVKRCHYSPWAFDVGGNINPREHPVFDRGLFEIEDEASQLATLLLNPRPGQRVLDLCAREGDHTLAISALMKNKGSLFVYDANSERLKTLKVRAQRAGVSNIRILSDSQIGEVKSLDAVLIDAPCSGTGVLARQPEIKWRFRKEDLPKI